MSKPERHYHTVKLVIERIVARKLGAPSLEELAQEAGMSSGHLQKVFTEWAGVTPKQFSRYLSLQYAKELLRENKNMLDTTLKTGLSSAGRLHDLFVDIEAMTPGEYQSHGKSLVISYDTFQTRFGWCLVASTTRGVCNILFGDTEREVVADLKTRWPKASLVHQKTRFQKEVQAYLSGVTPKAKIKLHLFGTNFQLKVWEALLSIPVGSIATYGDIAAKLGDKKLSRPVGAAVGENPVGYLIPCHRVLTSTGEISGYRWGVARKRAMLGFEALSRRTYP